MKKREKENVVKDFVVVGTISLRFSYIGGKTKDSSKSLADFQFAINLFNTRIHFVSKTSCFVFISRSAQEIIFEKLLYSNSTVIPSDFWLFRELIKFNLTNCKSEINLIAFFVTFSLDESKNTLSCETNDSCEKITI